MIRSGFSAIVAAGLAAFAFTANAALPTVGVTFTQPSGTVGPGDSVEVWVTMSIDANDVPLVLDEAMPDFGLDPADLPTQGSYRDPGTGEYVWADFVSYDWAYLNTWFGCDTTFGQSCTGGPPYGFSFHTSSKPGKPSINFVTSFELQPGESYEYLFGVFAPSAGPVPADTYVFRNTGVSLNFRGVDIDGNELHADVDLGRTCPPGGDPTCGFTRTVTAIPEPATWGSMSLGLMLLGAVAYRRGTRASRSSRG